MDRLPLNDTILCHIQRKYEFLRGFNTLNGMNIANDPTAPSFNGASLKIGGGAAALINAPLGKGQGTWSGRSDNLTLNVTTPMQELKRRVYRKCHLESCRRTADLSM